MKMKSCHSPVYLKNILKSIWEGGPQKTLALSALQSWSRILNREGVAKNGSLHAMKAKQQNKKIKKKQWKECFQSSQFQTFFTGGKWTAITPKFWVIAFLFIYSLSFSLGCYKRQPVGRCHWMDDTEAFFFDKLSPCCIWERGEWRTICICIYGNSTYHCWSPHCYYSLPSEQQFIF